MYEILLTYFNMHACSCVCAYAACVVCRPMYEINQLSIIQHKVEDEMGILTNFNPKSLQYQ